jgi:hypothetical protein
MWLNRFGISGGKPSITAIQLLLVGGGGATASATSGGGGGGGFIETYVYNIKNDWPIIIGNGGFNGSSDAYAGKPTSAFGLEAAGGGTGVHYYSSPPQVLGIGQYGSNSIDGGSGGGGWLNLSGPAGYGPGGLGNTPSYSPTQGYDGGASTGPSGGAGGGGGAGGVGSPNNSNIGGNGGNGRISTITGSTVYYAPGGGGYGSGGNGTGGLGSYGRGSTWSGGGQDANAGIAIIRYESSAPKATGGSISYISGYVIHTFTANGTFSVI